MNLNKTTEDAQFMLHEDFNKAGRRNVDELSDYDDSDSDDDDSDDDEFDEDSDDDIKQGNGDKKSQWCFYAKIGSTEGVIRARKYKQAASKFAHIYRRKYQTSDRTSTMQVELLRLTKKLVAFLIKNNVTDVRKAVQYIRVHKKTTSVPLAEIYKYNVSIQNKPHAFTVVKNGKREKITINTKVKVTLVSPKKKHFYKNIDILKKLNQHCR